MVLLYIFEFFEIFDIYGTLIMEHWLDHLNPYLLFFFLWLQAFLVTDELLLHQQVVLDTLRSQQFQAAACVGQNLGQLVGGLWSLCALLLLADACWHWRLVLLFLVLSKNDNLRQCLKAVGVKKPPENSNICFD